MGSLRQLSALSERHHLGVLMLRVVMFVAWESSDRAQRLPSDWSVRREFVRARAGGRCEGVLRDGSRCEAVGVECDHIERGDDHQVENLQWLCSWHHKRKTGIEARAELSALRARCEPRPRPHPGLIEQSFDGGAGDPVPPPA